MATGMRLANSFFDKRQAQKITFYKKGASRTPPYPIDYTAYREIDLTLISEDSAAMVENIRSRPNIEIGASTHLIQQIELCIPRFAFPRRRAGKPRGIPRTVRPCAQRTNYDNLD